MHRDHRELSFTRIALEPTVRTSSRFRDHAAALASILHTGPVIAARLRAQPSIRPRRAPRVAARR
ncbi:Hypothetical protein A7982_11736 [Minicystis rosea]|nr:Hypothetical protein A7982_11736 [Minicystis rosea]